MMSKLYGAQGVNKPALAPHVILDGQKAIVAFAL
jgi:hypothetical protein